MFAAELLRQIAHVAPCGYNVSSTSLTEYCWSMLSCFFKLLNNRCLSSFQYKFFCVLLHLLSNVRFETFTALTFTAQHAVAHWCSRSCSVWVSSEFALSNSALAKFRGHSNAPQQKSPLLNYVLLCCCATLVWTGILPSTTYHYVPSTSSTHTRLFLQCLSTSTPACLKKNLCSYVYAKINKQ